MTSATLHQPLLILPADATEAEWLACRREGVGGSDAATVMGRNKFATPLQTYFDKLGEYETEQTMAMRLGNLLEPIVAQLTTEETGWPIERNLGTWAHPDRLWQRVNLDGLIHTPEGVGVFEAKTTSIWQAGEWDEATGDVPEAAFWQVQHAMAVMGLDFAIVAALIGGQTFRWVRVDRDEALITRLTEAEEAFWTCVQERVEPVADGSGVTTALLTNKHPVDAIEDAVEVPDDLFDAWVSRSELKAHIEAAEAALGLVDNRLRQAIGDATSATYGGRLLATWKAQDRSDLDRKELKAQHPNLVAQFTRTSSVRVLRVKEAI